MWLIIVILTVFRAIRLVIYHPNRRWGRYMSYCPEGSQYYLNNVFTMIPLCQVRTRRALMQVKDVPSRTKRALSLYKVYGDSALLVLNGTLLNIIMPFWLSADDTNLYFRIYDQQYHVFSLYFNQQFQSQKSQIDKNGDIAFCDETL